MDSTASVFAPPPRPLADRIARAHRDPLRLLHRSDGGDRFSILGATGNVYSVALSADPKCTCPDDHRRRPPVPCKHVLFVLLRVLGVPSDDPSILRLCSPLLRPCELARLARAPTLPGVLAGPRVRERFHRAFSGAAAVAAASRRSPDRECGSTATCPVCLEEIAAASGIACGVCRNEVHRACLLAWKRSRGRRGANCVMCRARWRPRRGIGGGGGYVNLTVDAMEDDGSDGGERGPCAN
ncbi:hypothetical protein QJS04_geneDACA015665 [Acorus gramineus]|uniref:Mitogen-activated protein kinase kinase kinase 1 n=1 Tax=Acorus gramineus TaxID=55184 RepID=A0AAV9AK66_ACOGR|nr:hypothetical protein QJS04_geneDACA015665 [Acorus gramineus]